MNIPGLSVSMSASSITANMGVSLLAKVLDTAEMTGELLNEMIESSGVPALDGLGEHIDLRV